MLQLLRTEPASVMNLS